MPELVHKRGYRTRSSSPSASGRQGTDRRLVYGRKRGFPRKTQDKEVGEGLKARSKECADPSSDTTTPVRGDPDAFVPTATGAKRDFVEAIVVKQVDCVKASGEPAFSYPFLATRLIR